MFTECSVRFHICTWTLTPPLDNSFFQTFQQKLFVRTDFSWVLGLISWRLVRVWYVLFCSLESINSPRSLKKDALGQFELICKSLRPVRLCNGVSVPWSRGWNCRLLPWRQSHQVSLGELLCLVLGDVRCCFHATGHASGNVTTLFISLFFYKWRFLRYTWKSDGQSALKCTDALSY